MISTRDRLLAEGMRLFGERGYTATSVAQIEAAAGLSPGSGSLYKHFRSKEELLTEGMNRLLAGGEELADRLTPRRSEPPAEQLEAVVRAALGRLDEDRDVSRLLFRGLESFPELLQRFGTEEIGRFHAEAAALLASLADDPDGTTDWEAVAVVLQGATVHYWLTTDLFDSHPSGVDEDRFVEAVAGLVAGFLTRARRPETLRRPQDRSEGTS